MRYHLLSTSTCIDNLVADFTQKELKSILWDWYKHTVNGSFNESTTREEREAITSVYERISELLDVIYSNGEVKNN